MVRPCTGKETAVSENKFAPPMTFGEIQEIAAYLQASRLLPAALRNRAPDIALVIGTGQELGLHWSAALRGIKIVGGQAVLSADLMVGVVLASGAAEYFIEIDANSERAVYETRRKGAPAPQRAAFTMEDAKRAGLADDPSWQKYPGPMLSARARAALARKVFPDVLMGVYTEDEAREIAPDGFQAPPPVPEQITDNDVVGEQDATRSWSSLEAAIERCTTLADLEALLPRITALAQTERDALIGTYTEKRRKLEGAP